MTKSPTQPYPIGVIYSRICNLIHIGFVSMGLGIFGIVLAGLMILKPTTEELKSIIVEAGGYSLVMSDQEAVQQWPISFEIIIDQIVELTDMIIELDMLIMSVTLLMVSLLIEIVFLSYLNYGLGKMKHWARYTQILIASFGLFFFPLGTAFSVLNIYLLIGEPKTALAFREANGIKSQKINE